MTQEQIVLLIGGILSIGYWLWSNRSYFKSWFSSNQQSNLHDSREELLSHVLCLYDALEDNKEVCDILKNKVLPAVMEIYDEDEE